MALNAAFFVNAAILVVAAATFHTRGIVVTQIQQAHELLAPLLGTALASTAFAIALLCSGQSSTLTGTLAGQVVMEGFLQIRLRPWVRRLITRSIAIVPAVIVILIAGDGGTYKLLIASQVILSLQLPFAVIPLIQFTSDRKRMGEFASPRWVAVLAWIVAAIIIALNGKLIFDLLSDWVALPPPASTLAWSLASAGGGGVPPPAGLDHGAALHPGPPGGETAGSAGGLGGPQRAGGAGGPAGRPRPGPIPERQGGALLRARAGPGPGDGAGPGARGGGNRRAGLRKGRGGPGDPGGPGLPGSPVRRPERPRDQGRSILGFGVPSTALVEIAKENQLDLLVLGGHGHRLFGDMMKGQTISSVRHAVTIPVVTIRRTQAGEDEK